MLPDQNGLRVDSASPDYDPGGVNGSGKRRRRPLRSIASTFIGAGSAMRAVTEDGRKGAPHEAGWAPLLAVVMSVIPDPTVVVDVAGVIVAINPLAEAAFGYAAEELTGRQIEVLLPEWVRHVHRKHRADYAAAPRVRTMGAGLVLAGRRRDGTEFPVDVSLAPINVGEEVFVVAAIRDVTEQRSANAAQAQLAAIVQSSLDAIVAVTLEGVVTNWNPGAAGLFGYSPEEMIGRHLSCLVPDERSEELEELLGAVMAGRPSAPRDTRWLTKAATRLDVAISVSPLTDRRGPTAGFSLLIRDITERKRVEAGLRRQERWQAATAEIHLAMLSAWPVEELVALICRRTGELLDAGAMVVALTGGGVVTVVAGAGKCSPLVGVTLDPPPLLVADVLATGETRTANGAGHVDADPALSEALGSGPQLAAPVRSDRAVTGALVMVSHAGAFGPVDVAVVEGMAGAIALAAELAGARNDRENLLLAGDRERIALDLHDLVIQRLFGTGMSLQGVLSLIENSRAVGRIETAIEDLDTTIREIRTAIFELHPPPVARSGLRAEILQLVASAGEQIGFEPTVRFDGPIDTTVIDDVRIHVIAVVREGLSNIARHAHASRAQVEIHVEHDLLVVVADDGVGWGGSHRQSGLANLRSRAQNLGGSLHVTSPKGGGTRLEWRVPLLPPD
jgi:PAS domain S-box-containing protein